MKKILLIYPPSPVMNREDRCQQPTKELLVIPPLPPSDLMYLAAIAEKCGFKARIADYSLGGNLEDDLGDFAPDYLLVNVATPTFQTDLDSLRLAKKILPNIKTIAKGAPFLTSQTDALYECKALDLIIVGEAEETLTEILQGKKGLNDIQGLSYRDGFVAKFTGRRPFIENLDQIPFPARHLVDNNLFRRPDNNKIQAVIKVSRGCPFHCFFCLATPVSGSNVRVRTPENIIDEIRECVEVYGIKNFLFWSDCFNFNREWTINLCKAIIASDLEITWSSNTRADTADLEMAKLMYSAGCRLVSIGAESGSQFMLDKIGKKVTIDNIRETVKIFKACKIKVYNYFVIGLPWEDENTVEETIRFAIELDSDFISFYTATPLPGTRFHNYVLENSLFDGDNSFDNAYYFPVVKSHFLSKERIMQLHKYAIRRFYLRPRFIFKSILNIRSLTELKNYFLAGLTILRKSEFGNK